MTEQPDAFGLLHDRVHIEPGNGRAARVGPRRPRHEHTRGSKGEWCHGIRHVACRCGHWWWEVRCG